MPPTSRPLQVAHDLSPTSMSTPHPDGKLTSGLERPPFFHPVAPGLPRSPFLTLELLGLPPRLPAVLSRQHSGLPGPPAPRLARAPWSPPARGHLLRFYVCERSLTLRYLCCFFPQEALLKTTSSWWSPQTCSLSSLNLSLEVEGKEEGGKVTSETRALSRGESSYCERFQGQKYKTGTP